LLGVFLYISEAGHSGPARNASNLPAMLAQALQAVAGLRGGRARL